MIYTNLNKLFYSDVEDFIANDNRSEIGHWYGMLNFIIKTRLSAESNEHITVSIDPGATTLLDMYSMYSDVVEMLQVVEDTDQIGEHDSFYSLAMDILNYVTSPIVELGDLLEHVANLIEGGPFRYFVSESLRTYYVLFSDEEKNMLMDCRDSQELVVCFTDIMRRD